MLVSDGRSAVLARVLEAIGPGRVLVAVDGVGASGKTTFAAGLAERARPRPVVVLHADDFFHLAQVRHARGRWSPEGFWFDAYNYDALVSWALEPLARAGTGLYRPRSFDRGTGAEVRPEAVPAPGDALVIVEGTFLHRDELVRFWDGSVFLDVPRLEAQRRMRHRGGLDRENRTGLLERYDGAQELYFAHARPWERASIVVDNTEPAAPATIAPADAHAAHGT